LKIEFSENLAQVITSHRGVLDVYVYHRHGLPESIIVRKWPRKPTDRSGNFGKTHTAARLCLNAFRSLCPDMLNNSRPLFAHVVETYLDYFRSGNQSLYYAYENPPFIQCVKFGEYFPNIDKVEVFVHTLNISNLHFAFLPLINNQCPTFIDYRKGRKGLMRCAKLFRNWTKNTGPLKQTEPNLFTGLVPANTQLNFFDYNLTSTKHAPALSLPLIYKT